ncbi:MAG: hypothetical protein PHT58_03375 [Eubacteriales bacterium]|nr:hypothetical protein [Eubacteriales bacterium]
MIATKILDIENDGLNMAIDGQYLYIRAKRSFFKYDITDMRLVGQAVVFAKDGKSRNFAVCGKYIVAADYCDLLVIDKTDLHVVEIMRIGQDLSSDLGVVRFDEHDAYINVRNGKMAVLNIETLSVSKHDICEESSWEHCIVGNFLYTATVNGGLVEVDKTNMQMLRAAKPCRKNIYSIVYDDGILYTVSQDTTIKAIDIKTLAVIRSVNHAVKGMTRIIGIYRDSLVIANNGISLWDKQTFEMQGRIEIPTGQYNKGALLHDNLIIGSDFHNVYAYSM